MSSSHKSYNWGDKGGDPSAGPDLRGGRGPRPQASHQQRASYQTVHILFIANDRCLRDYDLVVAHLLIIVMRPSSLGGGRILRRTLSVCPSVPLLFLFILFYSRTVLRANIQNRKLRFPLMGQRHLRTFIGTRRGPHIVRPSRPHKLVEIYNAEKKTTTTYKPLTSFSSFHNISRSF